MLTANDIRRQFIDFFVQKHGHTFVPSSSVVPHDDPTLLFTNAGMNQFKDVFLGTGTRPYQRAVNSQKCIRVSGKHNDLEEVGRDTYHHTFFEMLGNWSFGDYYKAEAIQWAWELLTKEWKIDKSRLHATVFGGEPEYSLEPDDEAFRLWTKVTDIDPAHVHRFGKKDNFWMMGETGPCGPCSEIHIDRTPDKSGGKLVNAGDASVIEIWNLVFIQYNRDEAGKLAPLPARHVDTGMGFERVTAVLQGKESNYDTDVFSPIMDAISKLVGKKYGGRLDDLNDVAFRVIADHVRMLTFAITDGGRPSNKGRGAVIRSVLRRAFRFGYQCFGQREPFIHSLVPAVVAHMGGAHPELKSNLEGVQNMIRGEEVEFLRTLGHGMLRFRQAAAEAIAWQYAESRALDFQPRGLSPVAEGYRLDLADKHGNPQPAIIIPAEPDEMLAWRKANCRDTPRIFGAHVFGLHTTYGFPPDMTRQMARELQLDVEMDVYEALMREHEDKSRGGSRTAQALSAVSQDMPPDIYGFGSAFSSSGVPPPAARQNGALPATDDRPKWSGASCEGAVLGWIADKQYHSEDPVPEGEVGLLLDRTCFYAEQGGQVGDHGTARTPTGLFEVTQTVKLGNAVVHLGRVTEGRVEVGQTARLEVAAEREFTRKNHTTTHLLHWALRQVLGEHVEQRGSKVKPDEFTFDFSHTGPLTEAEKGEVERLVNEQIYQDLPVQWRELAIKEAQRLPGVRAFFGEKYGDVVRVVEIGDGFSREFCGGTHLDHTGQAGFFKIVGEESVAKGIRRLTCVTARAAVAAVQKQDAILADLTGRFRCKPEELPARIDSLQEEIKKLQQQLKKGAASDLQGSADKLLAGAAEVQGVKIIVGELPAGPEEQMRQQVDRLRQKAGSAVVVIGWSQDSKVQLIAAVTDDLVKKGLHAGKLIGQVAKVVGGGGGGKPSMAQAGGKEPAKLAEALELAKNLASQHLLE